MGVSKNRGVSPEIIHFNKVFHYKPSILGGFPLFWETSIICLLPTLCQLMFDGFLVCWRVPREKTGGCFVPCGWTRKTILFLMYQRSLVSNAPWCVCCDMLCVLVSLFSEPPQKKHVFFFGGEFCFCGKKHKHRCFFLG